MIRSTELRLYITHAPTPPILASRAAVASAIRTGFSPCSMTPLSSDVELGSEAHATAPKKKRIPALRIGPPLSKKSASASLCAFEWHIQGRRSAAETSKCRLQHRKGHDSG